MGRIIIHLASKIVRMTKSVFERMAEQLLSTFFAMEDGVLEPEILDSLVKEALLEYKNGDFKEAHIGKGVAKQRVSEVRGDKVLWLSKHDASPSLAVYWEYIDSFRTYLSDYFRVHLERTELHYAVYPIGAFYAPHRDQFRDYGNRVFSIILYLNKQWKQGDGGELRVYEGDSYRDISPIQGRLVCFRSDQILHEVLVANQPRISLTGWMRRDAFTL